jgi:protein TonB
MSTLAGNPLVWRLRGLAAQAGLVVAAIMVNFVLFALVGFLTTEHRAEQDLTNPVGVSLVTLAPAEPPKQEEVREAEPPPPAAEKPDFTPDLFQPAIAGPGTGDLAVSLNLGDVSTREDPAGMIFDSVDLDQAPQATTRIAPEYPFQARERGVEGYVAVKFLVRADGSVGNVNVLKAKPEGYFEDEVRRVLPRWTFQPGTIAGEPVPSWVVTTLRFDLN